MARIFSVVTKAGLSRMMDPLARALLRVGVTPDAVTVVGTLGVVVAAVTLATQGRLVVAARGGSTGRGGTSRRPCVGHASPTGRAEESRPEGCDDEGRVM